jgi:hypothetical protein
MCAETRKESPLPSLVYLAGWTFANFGSFCFSGISEAVVFCLPRLLLTSGPLGLLTFFIVFLPADVTSARRGLAHYFLVSIVFTMPINSTRFPSHFSCPTALGLSLLFHSQLFLSLEGFTLA